MSEKLTQVCPVCLGTKVIYDGETDSTEPCTYCIEGYIEEDVEFIEDTDPLGPVSEFPEDITEEYNDEKHTPLSDD